MGGVTRAVEKAGQQLGIVKKVAQTGGAQIPEAPSAPSTPVTPPTARQQEQVEQAARRRSRRGGRALLSDVRLNPEEGVGQSTLGTGPM